MSLTGGPERPGSGANLLSRIAFTVLSMRQLWQAGSHVLASLGGLRFTRGVRICGPVPGEKTG